MTSLSSSCSLITVWYFGLYLKVLAGVVTVKDQDEKIAESGGSHVAKDKTKNGQKLTWLRIKSFPAKP